MGQVSACRDKTTVSTPLCDRRMVITQLTNLVIRNWASADPNGGEKGVGKIAVPPAHGPTGLRWRDCVEGCWMDMGWRAGEKELEAWVRTRRLQRRRTYGGRILHGHFVLVRGDTRDVGRAPKLVLGASFETMYVKRWVDVTMEYDVRCTMYDVR